MTKDFKDTKYNIHKDIAKYEDEIYLIEETDDSITVIDMTDGFERTYCITDTDAMTKDWLSEKIIITPSAKESGLIDKDEITNWIFNKIPKETYQTVNKVVFIYNDEKDFDYLCNLKDEDFDNLLEVHDLPSDNQIGINWMTDCYIIIHIGNIVKSSEDMIHNGELYTYEKNDCIKWGIFTTIAHELRHLQQANPYISESVKFLDDPEEDAEEFARTVCQ